MWISYSDSEVNKFHPICQKALENALAQIGKKDEYAVLHHQHTGSLEMDFAIQNKNTGKYLCVVEVKRTPSDVQSARYQFQAMSYVQMNSGINEQPFYILTNLETAYAFRYDVSRPKSFQQMISPGLSKIGKFNECSENDFIGKLSDYFKIMLSNFIENKYDYLVTLDQFANIVENVKDQPKQWKTNLAYLLYEYIRGSFSFIHRNDLHNIRLFNKNISQICAEASKVNFKNIFNYSQDTFDNNIDVENAVISNLYKFGKQNVSGDSIASLLHQIVSNGHEHEGEVPTDLELARFVSVLAKYISGKIPEGKYLCDPAAGSGNLLSAAIEIFNLPANQIIANDINPKLLELLSLRLGLNFASTISLSNSPSISNYNIADLDEEYFKNIDVVVLNPPFVAGIYCTLRKNKLINKIKMLKNGNCLTSVGQMPLEAVFVELLTVLLQKGTTIACVFPKTHLIGRGIESQIIRKLLLEQFGLRIIFNYPGEQIFNNVTTDTCVLVGEIGKKADEISIIESYDNIPDIDIERFSQVISQYSSDEFIEIMPGIMAKNLTYMEMYSSIEDGWRETNNEKIESIKFINSYFTDKNRFEKFTKYENCIKRGRTANKGGSNLMFYDTKSDLYKNLMHKHIKFNLGMRNSDIILDFEPIVGDSMFLNSQINKEEDINQIIEKYMDSFSTKDKQKKKEKSFAEWKDLLKKESKYSFNGYLILIPRAIREVSKIHLFHDEIFVSTNFFVCSINDYNQALILASWMTTIFFQLMCEIHSKEYNGMRKMEDKDFMATYLPNIDNIPDEFLQKLLSIKNSIKPLNLKNPIIRDIDIFWANLIFGQEAQNILEEAQTLLSYLANKRNP